MRCLIGVADPSCCFLSLQLSYSRPGLEHTKAQYESNASRVKEPLPPLSPISPLSQGHLARWDAPPSPTQVPVNRHVVEKIAAPKTQNVRAMFESGAIADLHEVRKTRIADEETPESGVYENEPEQRSDILRESDQAEEGFRRGQTRSIVEEWGSAGERVAAVERAPIELAGDAGAVVESVPEVLSGVLRESDGGEEALPSRGHASAVVGRWGAPAEAGESRREVQLVEDRDQAGPAVCENVPDVRGDDVVRCDEMSDDVTFDQGRTRNLADYWATRRDDEGAVRRTQIDLVPGNAGPSVLENEPTVRDDICREGDDEGEGVCLREGHTRSIASRWQSPQETTAGARKPLFRMDLSDAPAVIENEPMQLDGSVVTGDCYTAPAAAVRPGQIRNIADRFNRPSEERANWSVPDMIQLDQSSGPTVVENEPTAPRRDVVRSDSLYSDDVADVTGGRTRSMLDQWRSMEADGGGSVSSRSGAGGKPLWVQEIEASTEPSVYENTPRSLAADVVREVDYNEAADLIPDRHTRSMKTMWAERDSEAESQRGGGSSTPQVKGIRVRRGRAPAKEPEPEPEPVPAPAAAPWGRGGRRRVLSRNLPPPTAPKPVVMAPTPPEPVEMTEEEKRKQRKGFKFRGDWRKK